jgi:23S rRNA G2445 N2-methylase RlmL
MPSRVVGRDARKALALGLAGKFPASWKPAEENAAVEVWLTIQEASAVCGLRLSDRTMRHRTYKLEHRPASLRPTVAAAMVRLAEIRPRHVVLDPMCGVGTILAEHLVAREQIRAEKGVTWGADLEFAAVRSAAGNLRRLGQLTLFQGDARHLPLPPASVDRIVSNPPFGKQLSDPEAIVPLYHGMVAEYDRILRPGGLAVLLVSAVSVLRSAALAVGWKPVRQVRFRVLGQNAVICVWQKGS